MARQQSIAEWLHSDCPRETGPPGGWISINPAAFSRSAWWAWRRDSIRWVIHVRRNTLVRCLLAHDEKELVERVPSVTDEELKRIGERADYHAFSNEDAMRNGGEGP